MTQAIISYRGWDIIREGTSYKIKGIPITCGTLEAAKKWIDFAKLDKPHKTTSFHK